MYLFNGIKMGQTTVINGVSYDISWFPNAGSDVLAALGVTYAPDPVLPDSTQYTWTVNPDGSLNVTPLSPVDATFIKNQHKAANIESMLLAAHSTEDAELSGTFAANVVTIGALLGLPKSLAVLGWSKSIWDLYDSRLPGIFPTYDPANDDFSSILDVPYAIGDLITEVGSALTTGAFTNALSTPTISGGILTLDLSIASNFQVSLNSNITSFTISNIASAGMICGFTLIFIADGSVRTVVWPTGIRWPDATGPILTTTIGKMDVFTFMSNDGGANWLAFIPGQNL